VTENELKLLTYLVSNFQRGNIKPQDPRTHLPYSQVLKDIGLPNDDRTPGESLNRHAMGGLAEWLSINGLPAITGVIINKLSDPNRPGMPSKSYFSFHGREDMDFAWLQQQLKLAGELNWELELSDRGLVVGDDFSLPDEVDDSLTEGAKKTITVNAYERNSEARDRCIKLYGLDCAVCSFNFESFYGLRGKDFIHVHHLTPLSEIGESYRVNPEHDLRPVCPNCHAMLHRKGNISIEELQKEISFIQAVESTSY